MDRMPACSARASSQREEGAQVGIVDRSVEALERVAGEITSAGGTAHAVVSDVGEPGAPARMIAEIRDALGPIDGLVNNAGIAAYGPISGENFDEPWDTAIAINLTAYALFIRAALADLKRNRSGRIVNIASTEALGATAGLLPYNASKAGVVGLTRGLAVELGPDGVTANCICPGPINTGMTASIPEEHKQKYARRHTALRRYGEPEEVAHITLSLLLPAASYITGTIIPVDGGLTIRNA